MHSVLPRMRIRDDDARFETLSIRIHLWWWCSELKQLRSEQAQAASVFELARATWLLEHLPTLVIGRTMPSSCVSSSYWRVGYVFL